MRFDRENGKLVVPGEWEMADGDTWEDLPDLPAACGCGNTLQWWWNHKGESRCMVCSPPVESMRRMALAYLVGNTARSDVSQTKAVAKDLKKKMGHEDVDYVRQVGSQPRRRKR